MHSFILSQCRDLRMGVIWEDLGALTTVCARQFWICCRRFIWDLEKLVERVTVVKFRVDNRGSNSTGSFRIKVSTDTAELTNMRIAGLRKWWDLTREGKIFIKDKTKVACRMSGIEWRVVYFRKLLFKTNNEKFCLGRVKSKKILCIEWNDIKLHVTEIDTTILNLF